MHLIQPLPFILSIVLSVAVVALLYGLLFVAHPRGWWTHASFDVDGYLEDHVLHSIQKGIADIRALSRNNYQRGAAKVTFSSTGVCTTSDVGGSAQTVKAMVMDKLAAAIPSLRQLPDAVEYTVEHLGAGLIDYDSPESVLKSKGLHPINRAIAEAGQLHGTAVADALFGRGLLHALLSLDEKSFLSMHAGGMTPVLAKAFEAADPLPNDPAAALLHAALKTARARDGWALITDELSIVVSACAGVAQFRHVAKAIAPQVRRMRMDRRPNLNYGQVFKMFNDPYLNEYIGKVSELWQGFLKRSKRSRNEAKLYVTKLRSALVSFIEGKEIGNDDAGKGRKSGLIEKVFGKRRALGAEGFEADDFAPYDYYRDPNFGIHVDDDGREAIVEEFSIKKEFKKVENAFKKAGKALEKGAKKALGPLVLIADFIKDVAKTLIYILQKLFDTFKLLFKDPPKFALSIVRVLLGVFLLVWLTLLSHWVELAVFVCIAFVPMALMVLLHTAIFLLAAVANLALSFVDVSSGGMIRFLARNEDHPEAWWRHAGFHAGNKPIRVFGTCTRCTDGFQPLAFTCKRVSRCVPLSSPTAMLVRLGKEGRLVPLLGASNAYMHTVLPSSDLACARKVADYNRQCTAPIKCNGFSIDDDVVLDMVLCACAGRMHFPGTDPQVTCAVCEAALQGNRYVRQASAMGYPAEVVSKTQRSWNLTDWAPMTQLGVAALGSVVAFAVVRGQPVFV